MVTGRTSKLHSTASDEGQGKSMRKPSKTQMEILERAVRNPHGAWVDVDTCRVHPKTVEALQLNRWFTRDRSFLHLTEDGLSAYRKYS